MRVAIYSRVSSSCQSTLNQVQELEELASRSGWTIVGRYDEVVSGTKSQDQRPELKRLLSDAQQNNFRKVVVWSCDRMARNLSTLLKILTELNACGVDIYSYKQGVDTETQMGRMFWQFLGIFSEFEHDMRRERQQLGIQKAKARGVAWGRPKIDGKLAAKVMDLRKEGLGYVAIGRALRVGTGTVVRVCNEHQIGRS